MTVCEKKSVKISENQCLNIKKIRHRLTQIITDKKIIFLKIYLNKIYLNQCKLVSDLGFGGVCFLHKKIILLCVLCVSVAEKSVKISENQCLISWGLQGDKE